MEWGTAWVMHLCLYEAHTMPCQRRSCSSTSSSGSILVTRTTTTHARAPRDVHAAAFNHVNEVVHIVVLLNVDVCVVDAVLRQHRLDGCNAQRGQRCGGHAKWQVWLQFSAFGGFKGVALTAVQTINMHTASFAQAPPSRSSLGLGTALV